MDKDCREMTEFVVWPATYHFEVMPSRLMSALAMFHNMTNRSQKNSPYARACLNDVVVFSKNILDHGLHLKNAFRNNFGA